MRIELLTPKRHDPYSAYLLRRPESLLYHAPQYLTFLEKLLGCENHTLIALEGDEIRGAIPLMIAHGDAGDVINGTPYYGSNSGIFAESAEACAMLRDAYHDLLDRPETLAATLIENPLAADRLPNIRHNYNDYRIGQSTPLRPEDAQADHFMARIDGSTRRNIKKAKNEGVTVSIDADQFDWLEATHRANMAEIGGNAKAHDFFALVPQHFSNDDFRLYVARQDGAPVAALLVFYFNRTVEYFTPVTLADARSTQPLAAILIDAITDAARRGFTHWNWGGTWVTQTGVYRFKHKWAAQDRRYNYYVQVNDARLLTWTAAELLTAYPSFYVLPFSALKQGEIGS